MAKKTNAFIEWFKTTKDFISRWFWHIVHHIAKVRYLIITIVLLVPALLLIQYLQELTRPPFMNNSSTASGNLQVVMWHPDRVGVGEKYAGQIEFEFHSDRMLTHAITITMESASTAAEFMPKLLTLTPNANGIIESQYITVTYKRVKDLEKLFPVTAEVQYSTTQMVPIEATIQVVKQINWEIFIRLSSVASFVSALVTIVLHLKQLFDNRKKEKAHSSSRSGGSNSVT